MNSSRTSFGEYIISRISSRSRCTLLRRCETMFQSGVPLVPIFFVLNVFLVFPVFFPNLSNMDMFDESIYINIGRHLTEGNLPTYAWNPLVAFLYALAYIPVQTSPYWLIHCSTIGRFALFGLLWLSSHLIAKLISPLSHPLIMIVILLVSPVLTSLLRNPSDALFAAMSGLAFWQFLSFYNNKKIRHLGLSSVFVALAALSRNDGLILFLTFIILSVLLSKPVKRVSTSLAACIIPFAIIVGGYVLLYGLFTGSFKFGTAERAYFAFEQGQEVPYRNLNFCVEGIFEARRLFGTPEENQHSIINAIRRNPKAFLLRVVQKGKKIPLQIFSIYGAGLGLIFFFLAARGIIEIAGKSYMLLCVMLLWPFHLLVYFLTFFRLPYFILPYFVVFSLTTVGLTSMLSNFESRKERYSWFVTLLGIAILAKLVNKPSIFVASLVFLLGLWIIRIIMSKHQNLRAKKLIGLIMILFIALVMRGGYPSPKFRTLGIAPDEKAALFMREHLEPDARVGAFAPGNVWIANMTYVPMWCFRLHCMTSDQGLSAWIVDNNVEVIYVDKALKYFEPSVWALIKRQIAKSLRVAFTSDEGDVQVLLTTQY